MLPVTAPYPLPDNEAERLLALRRLGLVGTGSTPALDRLCRLALRAFDVAGSHVVLVDGDQAWLKAGSGYPAGHLPREHSFCTHALTDDTLLVVPDTREDARFLAYPAVLGDEPVRFYAGAPLLAAPSVRLGAFCLLDHRPRQLDARDTALLQHLARCAMDELRLESLLGPEMVPAAPRSGPAPITARQMRAARGLLNWSVRELAEASGVSPATLKRMELGEGGSPRPRNQERVRQALERGGVEFTAEPGRPAGVRPCRLDP